jgi:predicted phage tail protein
MARHGASRFLTSMLAWAAGTVLGVLSAAGASLALTSGVRQYAAPAPRASRPASRSAATAQALPSARGLPVQARQPTPTARPA